MTIDAHLPGGKRADAILTDAQGGIELVIQLEGGSKLANRIDSRGGLPLVVLRAATLADEPHRWRDDARARHAGLALPVRGHAIAPGR